jgi:HSP20 family molecular chaperone IbpA
LKIEVALAGYNKDNINLSFDTDHLILTIKKPRVPNEEFVDLQRGIKNVEDAVIKWKIDPRYYDRESVDAKFNDGLLTIFVNPRTEVAPKKISIFGDLQLESAEQKPQVEDKSTAE